MKKIGLKIGQQLGTDIKTLEQKTFHVPKTVQLQKFVGCIVVGGAKLVDDMLSCQHATLKFGVLELFVIALEAQGLAAATSV